MNTVTLDVQGLVVKVVIVVIVVTVAIVGRRGNMYMQAGTSIQVCVACLGASMYVGMCVWLITYTYVRRLSTRMCMHACMHAGACGAM